MPCRYRRFDNAYTRDVCADQVEQVCPATLLLQYLFAKLGFVTEDQQHLAQRTIDKLGFRSFPSDSDRCWWRNLTRTGQDLYK